MVLLFWKILIKKIINQGKNIIFSFPNWKEKKGKEILKITSRIHIYNKNLHISNPQKKKIQQIYNIFSETTFLYLFIIFPTNKQLPHITPFSITDNLFVAQGMQVTPEAKLYDNAIEMWGFKLGMELRQKGWMVQHLPLHLHSLHLLLLHQGLFVHHPHRVDVTYILKSLY